MRARNRKQIIRGYLSFTVGLLISSSIGITTIYGFIKTSKAEFSQMEVKTKEYDKIYSRQIELTEKVDSLYNYIIHMGKDNSVNQYVLQSKISTAKMELANSLSAMNGKDVLLYNRMSSQINSFLDTKEDIRKISIEENMIKSDLKRCIEDNRVATRKLTIGKIQIQR